MRLTTRSRSRRLVRGVTAAGAGLALAAGLTACTIGDVDTGNTDNPTAADTSTSRVEDSPVPEDPRPAAGVDQLVLTAEDAPEFGLQPVDAQELTGDLSALQGISEQARVEPAHCVDFNRDNILQQTAPGTMALQAGAAGATSVAVGVTSATDDLPGRARLIEECADMTTVFPVQGQEIVTYSTNTPLDVPAPEGVEEFAAVAQDSSTELMGQQARAGTVVITGIVRGVGVTVTAAVAEGELTEQDRAAALDLFERQAAKVSGAL